MENDEFTYAGNSAESIYAMRDKMQAQARMQAEASRLGPARTLSGISGATVGAKPSELALAVEEGRAIGKLLAEIRSEIANLSVRLGGADAPPDDCATSDRPIFHDGLVGDVRRALNDAQATSLDVLAILSRLRTVV